MSPQARIALGVVAIVAVIAVGWIALLGPKRAEMNAADARIVQAQSRTGAATVAVAKAEQARAELKRDSASLARLAKAVPKDDDVGPLVRQLDAIARANKIDFRSAKLVAGGDSGAAAAPAAPAAASGAATTEGKPDAAKAADGAAPQAPVAAVVAQPPPGAVVGDAGLLTVPFSFTFDGGYAAMQRFLAAVHGLARSNHGKISVRGRLITIDGFSLGAGREGFPKVKATVSATAYLLPAPAAAAAAATTPAGAA
ncbi:MAG: hypothetical protein QOG42_202, partial [Solirubrobacteraceae bacterium]|nr:hypothetical protein [Solirubrobacteraceae bacterium]